MPAMATAKSVMASAKRLMEVRHFCWKRRRMALMSVPAWPMPIHQTKLVMSKAQATGMLLPQAPMPTTSGGAEREQPEAHPRGQRGEEQLPAPAWWGRRAA